MSGVDPRVAALSYTTPEQRAEQVSRELGRRMAVIERTATVGSAPASSAKHTIRDEGSPLAQRGSLDFQGAGVTATDDAAGDKTVVTIPGGGGGSVSDASTTVKGVTKLSVAPASATDPIAAGDNDSRLTNACTPTAHKSTHEPGGSDAMTVDAAAATGSLRTLGTGAQQATAGNDSRLSDARSPTAHKTSHEPGGTDALTGLTNASLAAGAAIAETKQAVRPSEGLRALLQVNNLVNPSTAVGHYIFRQGATVLGSGVGGGAHDATLVYLAAADYAMTGKTTKLMIRAQCATNATAPAASFIVGLYPVSSVTGAGGLIAYTLGTKITGSTITFTTPAASTLSQSILAADLTFPANGSYIPGVEIAGASTAANSIVGLHFHLFVKYV